MRGLTKTFTTGVEPVHAVADATLALMPEEVVGLVGPSGSGKTTLLMSILGWDVPDAGEVVWRGDPRPDLGTLEWRDVAIVGQRLGLVEELTVEDNVELPLLIAGVPEAESDERTEAALESLDLAEIAHRNPPETSLGEQQRTAIARAVVVRPRLLVADEPTSHQDTARKRLVFAHLKEHASLGGACLIATHDPDTLSVCNRTIRMDSGRIVDVEVTA
ncbi:MAG: ATP-binding cassette domain-containing protein [Actinomycetota bacterium]|nr:ATP-binding cassette domain-containing protein [Actinomycetota bacterium]